MKKQLKKIESNIVFWEQLCKEYPKSAEYAKMLNSLYLERTALVNTIGSKKK